jgi:cobalt/nickel transport system ATP-binding protein
MSSPLLDCRNLRFAYPGNDYASGKKRDAALADCTLSIATGARLALLGGNGAGKSTLLLHLNGTLRPQAGEIRFDGVLVDYSRKGLTAWRQAVALVFQDPDDQLFAGTVRQDISFGPINLGLDKAEISARVLHAVKTLGLEALADLPPHLLSHGQRKRAALAGALAMRPRLLVLDEPTAGLDPQGVKEMLGWLEVLHRDGTGIVLSTHDVEFAHQWANEVAVMQRGVVIAAGPTEAILSDETLMKTAQLRVPFAIKVRAALKGNPAMGNLAEILARCYD